MNLVFVSGQARLDGAFCDYTKEDKMMFLRRIHEKGICNIEMESLCFAAYCHRANIRGMVGLLCHQLYMKYDSSVVPSIL